MENGKLRDARFGYPMGIAKVGKDYYTTDTENQTIRRISSPGGTVSTFAGVLADAGSNDGVGTAARFQYPENMAGDDKFLYVGDRQNGTIRRIDLRTRQVTTYAGKAGDLGHQDGDRTSARFSWPGAITLYRGNLYVADEINYTVRRIDLRTGWVSTLAGKAGERGAKDGSPATARFGMLANLTVLRDGLFVADQSNHTIRRIDLKTGQVATIAGKAGESGHSDGFGGDARFNGPYGIATDGRVLYVTDANELVRKIDPSTGRVETLAGRVGIIGSDDGAGRQSTFFEPGNLVYDHGSLMIADTYNCSVRRLSLKTHQVSTFAGHAETLGAKDGRASDARFRHITGMVQVGSFVYVVDSENHAIRKFDPTAGTVELYAGGLHLAGLADGDRLQARFNFPYGIAGDGRNLYVSDQKNNAVRKINLGTEEVSTIPGRFVQPWGVTVLGDDLYVAEDDQVIRKVNLKSGQAFPFVGKADQSGNIDGIGEEARLNKPKGMTTDGNNLYVVDAGNHAVRKITPSGEVTTLATGVTLRNGKHINFFIPLGITSDGTQLFITDTWASHIYQIDIQSGNVTHLAGPDLEEHGENSQHWDIDGPLRTARADIPEAILYTPSGLLIGNPFNIRRIH